MALDPGPASLGVAWLEPTTGEFSVGRVGRPRPLRAPARRDRRHAARARSWPAATRSCRPGCPTPRSRRAPSPAPRSTTAPSTPTAPAASCSPTSASRRSRPSAARACRAPRPPPAPRCATCARRRSATSPTSRASRPAPRRTCSRSTRVTRRNLELVESLADGSRRGTLLDVLDHTRTAMGARLLREWILRPLVELERVQDRLDAVEELAFRALDRGRLREALAAVQDLDRLLGRVALGTAGPARPRWPSAGRCGRCPARPRRVADCVAPLVRCQAKELDPPLDLADDVAAARSSTSRPPSCTRAASSATASTPSSTSCARRAAAAARRSRPSRSASARGRASRP